MGSKETVACISRTRALEFIAQSVKSDVDMALIADAIKALEQEPRKGHWKHNKCEYTKDHT